MKSYSGQFLPIAPANDAIISQALREGHTKIPKRNDFRQRILFFGTIFSAGRTNIKLGLGPSSKRRANFIRQHIISVDGGAKLE